MHDKTFVEIGASDGVLMSFTSWLEYNNNWRGLLLEPNPQSFDALRMRRKSAAAKTCVSPEATVKDLLWSPNVEPELPDLFQKVARARTTLKKFVSEEDYDAGSFSPVQCFPLPWLLKAWDPSVKTIHLLVIHTMGGEMNILETVPKNLDIIMLVIRFNTPVDRSQIESVVNDYNLIPFKEEIKPKNFLIFISTRVVFHA
ncbi:unnamed protein product, partial [Meganyctiphanes norvegica]